MAYGFQFAKTRLSRALTEPLQQRLQSVCPPPSPGLIIDRMDVVPDGASFHPVPGPGDALDVHLGLQLFVMPLQDVLNTPFDQDPPSALTPRSAVLRVRLRVEGTKIVSELLPLDLSGTLPPPLDHEVAKRLQDLLGPVVNREVFDGMALLDEYELPPPQVARFVVMPSAIQLEFDPSGTVMDRAGPGQEWGLFIDAAPAIAFGLSRLPPALRSGLISTSAEWAPQGSTPRLLARAEVNVGVLVFKLPLEFRMTMPPAKQPTLRIDVNWDVEVDAATVLGVPVSVLFKLARHPGT